jgi:hypothetical protein
MHCRAQREAFTCSRAAPKPIFWRTFPPIIAGITTAAAAAPPLCVMMATGHGRIMP